MCEDLLAFAHPHVASAGDPVPGSTVRNKVLVHGPATEEEARALLLGIARALQALHGCSILHRGVSPASVVLRDGAWDQPVLVDLSQRKGGAAEEDQLPGYVDPAVLRGGEPSMRGDLFSAGMVARYALTATDWEGGPVDFPDGLSQGLRELLVRLTCGEPAQRPAMAEEVIVALVRGKGTR